MTHTGWQYVVMEANGTAAHCERCTHRAIHYGLGPCPTHAPDTDAYTLPDGTTR